MVDSTVWELLVVGTGCLAAGYYFGLRRRPSSSGKVSKLSPLDFNPYHGKDEPHEVEDLADLFEDFKMVLVVRNDLKMGKGKVAAQCSHAALGLYRKIFYRAPKALQRWEASSQVKVVCRVESENELLQLQMDAKSMKLPTHITIDAGRTQIAPNSRTVMAVIGPRSIVDDVTGDLKLL